MKTPHTRRTRLITAVLAALAFGAWLGSAHAAVFKDAQLESLHEAGKFAELEQQAHIRLRASPADAEASAALVLGSSLTDPTTDAKRLEAGAQQAKLCTDRHPAVAVCHLAAAQNLSLQMLNMGMAKAMRSVGSLKDVWTRTLELEPTSFTARVQLAKLYVMLPGMMGGSTSKAKELEAAVRSSQPETARNIRVHIAGGAKKWAETEADKDLATARSLYESLQRDQPSRAAGFYGAARVQAALGQPDESVRLFERAKPANVEEVRKSLAKLG